MPESARADEHRVGRFDRGEALGRLATETFDVLVIGGGITGAGVALDAASRGLRTALVEKDDFASGTSSKSSKLIHGGLRYLQQHEYRLVYENLAERQRLLENAPHLVSPLPFLIPLFGRDGVVNRGVARVYLTALWLYDLTGGMRIGRRHEKVSRAEALAHLPTLRADRLAAGFLYWDARADDARLTLTVVRTAVLDHGAVAANHTPVTDLLTGPDGRVHGARVAPEGVAALRDPGLGGGQCRRRLVRRGPNPRRGPRPPLHPPGQGDPHHRPERGLPLRHRRGHPGAGGPPVDLRRVVGRPGLPGHDRHPLRRTARRPELPARGRRLRPRRRPTPSPTVPIGREDITGVWTGLRPLLAPVAGKHAPSERTADLSRRHTVSTSASGVVTVTGGKLTTYRKMAEDTVDAVAAALGRRSLGCVDQAISGSGGRGAPTG